MGHSRTRCPYDAFLLSAPSIPVLTRYIAWAYGRSDFRHRSPSQAYLFLAENERDAEEYADGIRDHDPQAVTRELVLWKDAEKWVDQGTYPPPSFTGARRPMCFDGPLAWQSISTERPDQVIRMSRFDRDGHHGTYVLEGRIDVSGYYWYPDTVK